jgi:hypothetical protein
MKPAQRLLLALPAALGLAVVVWANRSALAPPLALAEPDAPSPYRQPEPATPALPQSPATKRSTHSSCRQVGVTLELIRAAALDVVHSEPALGSGRDAQLLGQLVGVHGEPITGNVTFAAGPNRGRSATTDAGGRFVLAQLYPGRNVLEVSRSGQCLAHREVHLTASTSSRWILTLASPGRLAGQIVSADGKAIAGALVRIDGQRLHSNSEGEFPATVIPCGAVLIEVTADGFAATRHRSDLEPQQEIRAEDLIITMRAESQLQLQLAQGEREPAQVWLLPVTSEQAAATPWERFGALQVDHEATVIRGLPSGRHRLFAHRVGAHFVGGARVLDLVAGSLLAVDLEFVPVAAREGRVQLDGAPIAGAVITTREPDARAATARLLGLPTKAFAHACLPLLPPAQEQTISDADGRFRLAGGDDATPWRELTVASHGVPGVVRPLWHNENPLRIELSPASANVEDLTLEFPAQSCDLQVEIVVQGVQQTPRMIARGEPLVLENLTRGIWRLQVTTGAVEQLLLPALHIGAVRHVSIALPE